MSKVIYLAVGAAAGAAAVYLYFNAPATSNASGAVNNATNAFSDAVGKATRWGTGQRITGSGTQALGKAKQGLGEAVGNEQLANEGVFDQAKGAVKDAAGQAAHGAVELAREFNQ